MRVVVSMSGGVDSSVCAYLLKHQGYEPIGIFMKIGVLSYSRATCCSLEDAFDARRVADKLRIPFYSLDMSFSFAPIIDYFIQSYNRGYTPNPCIMCNKILKFGRLWYYVKALGADAIATGHYAKICNRNGRYVLEKGVDPSKDQSYVLFTLTQEQLPHVLFPLGEYTKAQVREIAAKVNLPVRDKPESQDICFVPGGDYPRFLWSRIPSEIREGQIHTIDGKVIGYHPGYQFFTIGQRKGLRVALGKPLYVVAIDPFKNVITVGEESDLYRSEMVVGDVNWVSFDRPSVRDVINVDVKIRYTHSPAPAKLSVLDDGRVRIKFDRPQRAITPGQAAVFYQGQGVLGGGWIER
jgi:tRNA-specific 2-thiouridylase